MSKIKNLLLFILLPLTIAGCNEGSNNEDQPPQQKITINAQDSLSFSPTKNTQVIDLRQKVTAEDNQDLIIEDIESIDNNECIFNNINGLTFKVTTNGAGVCRFKYHVKPQSSKYKGTSEAIAQVVVTEDYTKGDFLPPVSHTITESTSLYLDKKDLLIESGFEIDPTSVYLTGETASSDIGNFTADGSSITYQAPSDTTGTVRIFYTEIDSINNIARPGVVYIAIGQKGNHNPVALNKRLEPLAMTQGDINIDISDYISDQDKADDLQLIDVKPFLGTIKINSEHSFIYSPEKDGTEVLTYIISDHNGGYGIGKLSFIVTTYETILDVKQDLTFTPPLTINQLSETGGIYTDIYQETNVTGLTGIYPTFDKVLAEAYCTTKGMAIASLESLQAMRTNVLNDMPIFSTKYLWHSGKPYLTLDSNDAISLDTGEVVPSVTDGYFTCTDSLASRSWNFVSPYYGAKYAVPTTVYLSAGSVFLPKDSYNLSYAVESMNVNGELIDPSREKEFIRVNIIGNTITVKKVNTGSDNFAVNVTLLISDPIADTSTTKVILGVTVCPTDIINPPDADRLGCIYPLKGQNNELFTAPLSNNMLKTMGGDPSEYNHIGNRYVGGGDTFFRGITWSNSIITKEHRTTWLNVVSKSCNALNKLKLAGRNNWQAGSSTIIDLDPTVEADRLLFTSSSDPAILTNYPSWLANIDHAPNYALYGLGYINSDPSDINYVNQSSNSPTFYQQSNMSWYNDTITFPSCWSKN